MTRKQEAKIDAQLALKSIEKLVPAFVNTDDKITLMAAIESLNNAIKTLETVQEIPENVQQTPASNTIQKDKRQGNISECMGS